MNGNPRREKVAACAKGFKVAILVLLLFVVGGRLSGVVYSQNLNVKIACVDIQRAINECDAGKEARRALSKDVEKIQNLIFEKQRELQEMKESFDKQSLMLSPEARASREKELQARFRDYQRWGEDVQNEMNQKKLEMEKTIFISLQKVIQKLGADGGYTLILEKSETFVLFASKPTDITDLVIKAHDVQKK
jgi:outer membrane protein